MPRALIGVAGLMIALGCGEEAEEVERTVVEEAVVEGAVDGWGSWPGDVEEARSLVESRSALDGAPAVELDANTLLAAVGSAAEEGTLIAGWSALQRWAEARPSVGRRYVLFGVSHDSGEQLRVFRRLFVTGSGRADLIALEMLDADGHWTNLPDDAQRGDDEALARALDTTTAPRDEAFPRLFASLERGNYTAWKYDYLDQLEDLVFTARATETPLTGCDVPPSLDARLPDDETLALRLREVHCASHLEDLLDAPTALVAIAYGSTHVEPDGLRRFLPEASELDAVRLLGARRGVAGLERELAPRLAIRDPVLAPLARDEWALLVPGPRWAANGARALVRERHEVDPPNGQLVVSSTEPGRLRFASSDGPVAIDVGDERLTRAVTGGSATYAFETDSLTIVGALEIPVGGSVALDFVPEDRRADVTYYQTR